jgi:excisionase family DNA binding protein
VNVSESPGRARIPESQCPRGREASNRPLLAPQPVHDAAQPSPDLANSLEAFESASHPAVQGSQGSSAIRRDFAANLLPTIEQLLTVRQVAQLLGVCRATVYKWATAGALPHVRIINLVRVRSQDLVAFVAQHWNGSQPLG